MLPNVYTKDEILKELSSKGYFIDTYTLGTFLEQWKVEAIYEDEQGVEFYDKNTLDLVLNNLFNEPKKEEAQNEDAMPVLEDDENKNSENLNEEEKHDEPQEAQNQEEVSEQENFENQEEAKMQENEERENQQEPAQDQEIAEQENAQNDFDAKTEPPVQTEAEKPQENEEPKPQPAQEPESEPIVEQNQEQTQEPEKELENPQENKEISPEPESEPDFQENEDQKTTENENSDQTEQQEDQNPPVEQDLLEDALKVQSQVTEEMVKQTEINHVPQMFENEEDIDDMSLISDSFEAQEKFREYVLSQMAKNNPELAPKNEFKLDISERTLNMIAKALAKKIAKHVSSMFGAEAKSIARFDELKEKNKFLEQKVQTLEEQNKKLRMLLTESNRNLNSYKPGLFGLYKKVPPKR